MSFLHGATPTKEGDDAHTSVGASIKLGWEKVTLSIDGANRNLLWKGPAQWSKGAIIVMHGGGGNYANWCYAPRTGIRIIDETLKAQVDFSTKAIEGGFAVFSLDSSSDLVTDEKGLPCGKRFDATVVDGRKNVDLPFIEKVITEVMVSKRPQGSSSAVFMTGESTGGFMTVRASTHLDGLVTAFAPGAACDPYGTYFDASVVTGREARGVAIDRETKKRITENNAAGSPDVASYPHEKEWVTMNPSQKPPFLSMHHEDDGIVDRSCHKKLVKQLLAHGYKGDALVIKGKGKKNVESHLWQAAYNVPALVFFSKVSSSSNPTKDAASPSSSQPQVSENKSLSPGNQPITRGHEKRSGDPPALLGGDLSTWIVRKEIDYF